MGTVIQQLAREVLQIEQVAVLWADTGQIGSAGSSSASRQTQMTGGATYQCAIELRDIIAKLRDNGKAIIFSTHIMSEAEQLCDRIAIIHHGRILAIDTLDGLRESTGHHYLEDIFVHYANSSGSDDAIGAVSDEVVG